MATKLVVLARVGGVVASSPSITGGKGTKVCGSGDVRSAAIWAAALWSVGIPPTLWTEVGVALCRKMYTLLT